MDDCFALFDPAHTGRMNIDDLEEIAHTEGDLGQTMIEDVYDYLDEMAVDGRPPATTIDKSRFFVTFLCAIGFADEEDAEPVCPPPQ